MLHCVHQYLAVLVLVLAGALGVSARAAGTDAAGDWTFESGAFTGKISSGAEENRVEVSATTEGARAGSHALRVDFELPARFRQVRVVPFAMQAGSLGAEQWGLSFWVKTRGTQNVNLSLWAIEENGETWGAWIPQQGIDGLESEWYQVPLVLDLLQLIPWTRVDGKFERERVTALALVMEPSGGDGSTGTIWLDDFELRAASQTVGTEERDDFTLLDLEGIFNSDGVASAANPLDGDFLTGEWQHRTLPAEEFPRGPVATFSKIPFRMPEIADGRNNHIRANGQVLAGFPAEHYSALYVFATGKFGDQLGDVVLHYDDGTSVPVLLEVSDWSLGAMHGEGQGVKFTYAYHGNERDVRTPEIFVQSLRVDRSRRLRAIGLPMRDYLKIFALTLSRAEVPPAVGALQTRSLDEIHPRYERKALAEIDFTTTAPAAGPYGGYLAEKHGSPVLNIPTYNGGLAFQCDVRAFPLQKLIWTGQGKDEKPLELGGLAPIGAPETKPQTELLNEGTLVHRAVLGVAADNAEFTMLLSRLSPAALYATDARKLMWMGDERGPGACVAYVADGGGVAVAELRDGRALPTPAEPWLLVWPAGLADDDFAVPMLLVLERRPSLLRGSGNHALRMEFERGAGLIAAMPLRGITRFDASEVRAWGQQLPADIAEECRAWSRRLQAYPVGVQRHTELRDERVDYTDTFNYRRFASEWNVAAETIAPLPPIVAFARQQGYPVKMETASAPTTTGLATFWGPYVIAAGDSVRFTLPRPAAIDRVLAPAQVTGTPLVDQMREQLAEMIDDHLPSNLNSSNCGDASMLRLLATLPLLTGEPNARVADHCRAVVRHQLEDNNLKVEKELMTGGYFLMDDRFWAKDEPYDKEWAIGLLLQGLWAEAHYLNDYDLLRANWNKVAGLYRYYELIFDWASGSTYTMVTGVGANADGIRFAWDGMLAMARMAREVGDDRLYLDATQRSAMQMLNLYATWHLPRYAAEQRYAMQRDHPIAPERAETRFAPDSMSECFTCNVSRTTEFFQMVHALYLYNLGDLAFLHDYGLDARFVEPWLRTTVNELHPQWADGNAWGEGSNRYYGNEQAIALIVTRALLGYGPIDELNAAFQKMLEPTLAQREWYAPAGNAPFALAAMLVGSAPMVEAPIGPFVITRNQYNIATGAQRITLSGRRAGTSMLRVRCWGQAPQAVRVDGKAQVVNYDAALDIATIKLNARPGSDVSLELDYAPRP